MNFHPKRLVALVGLISLLAAGCGGGGGGTTTTTTGVFGTCPSPRPLPTDGQVLLSGGVNNVSTTLASVELYDPPSETFIADCNLNTPRKFHQQVAVTVPPSPTTTAVLVAGGLSAGNVALGSAESFDPDTSVFSTVSPGLSAGRDNFTAVSISASGSILFAGGFGTANVPQATADLFEASGTFSELPVSMTVPRANYGASVLTTGANSGNVLITGGNSTGFTSGVVASAEIFDPIALAFTALTPAMTDSRQFQSQVTLPDGTVLIAGGQDATGKFVNTAEIYDAVADTFTATIGTMASAHANAVPILFTAGTDSGMVLIAGGSITNGNTPTSFAEIYNPVAGTFTATGPMQMPRANYTATLLADGVSVLITGGFGVGGAALDTAEIYCSDNVFAAYPPCNTTAAAGTFTLLTNTMETTRAAHQATLINLP